MSFLSVPTAAVKSVSSSSLATPVSVSRNTSTPGVNRTDSQTSFYLRKNEAEQPLQDPDEVLSARNHLHAISSRLKAYVGTVKERASWATRKRELHPKKTEFAQEVLRSIRLKAEHDERALR